MIFGVRILQRSASHAIYDTTSTIIFSMTETRHRKKREQLVTSGLLHLFDETEGTTKKYAPWHRE